jgi:hypothetical protein
MGLCKLTFVEEKASSVVNCLSNSCSRSMGKLAVRVCEVGQLHFRRESGKEMGLSYKPAPSRLFGSTFSWLKRARFKLPLACTVHQHFFRQYKASDGLRTNVNNRL